MVRGFKSLSRYHGAVAKEVTAAALYAEDAQVQALPAPSEEIADEKTGLVAYIDGPLAQW
jgi:hypothetical protein